MKKTALRLFPMVLITVMLVFSLVNALSGAKTPVVSPYPAPRVSESSSEHNSQPPAAASGSAEISGGAELPSLTSAVSEAPALLDPAPPAETASDTGGYITLKLSPGDIRRGNLILVNRVFRYGLPDGKELTDIISAKTPSYKVASDGMLIDPSVIEPINTMMDAFYTETGLDTVTVVSAFRDYDKQQGIVDDYTDDVGWPEAARWAAQPGYSEHHAGLALDFSVYSNGVLGVFDGTGDYAWFKDNSYKYGFILRYTDEKSSVTHTASEPWHFRYVGNPHAGFMYENGLCLEEYMKLIAEHTQDEPFTGVYAGALYSVYYVETDRVSDVSIEVPADAAFDVSGDNYAGFVVTLRESQRNN